MKTSVAGLLSLPLILSLNACTSSKDRAPHAALDVHPRYEELSTEVPTRFSDAQKWNQEKICPEGATLTPFTRYDYDSGQNSQGFKQYYGRTCAIIQTTDAEVEMRKLASIDPSEAQTTVTLIPHGPFIWWYENGKKMETGTFDHGTLSANPIRYEPDGSNAAKD